MRAWGQRRVAESAEDRGESLAERAPRPIWLPQLAEPVTLLVGAGEKLPGKVLERSARELLVAVVVPLRVATKKRLHTLVLEYRNPGGLVRLSGQVTLEGTDDGALVRIADPQMLEVRQERAHVRVPAQCPMVLRAGPETDAIHTHSEDLSAGGALLGTPEPLRVGDELALTLTLDQAEPPIAARATVVRVDGRGHAGVRFDGLSTYDQWRLVHYTVECQSREEFRHAEHERGTSSSGG